MRDRDTDPKDVIRAVRHEGRAVVLELAGEIDMQCSTTLRGKLMELFTARPSVLVVNMTQVGFMDSSGLATLVEALKWCHRNGSQLKLVGLAEGVRSVFEIARLESLFQIYDSEAEALSQ